MIEKNKMKKIAIAGTLLGALASADVRGVEPENFEVRGNRDSLIEDVVLRGDLEQCNVKLDDILRNVNQSNSTRGNFEISYNVYNKFEPDCESFQVEKLDTKQSSSPEKIKAFYCRDPIRSDSYIIDGNRHEIKECDTNRKGSAGDELLKLLPEERYLVEGEEMSKNGIKFYANNLRNKKVNEISIMPYTQEPTQIILTETPQQQELTASNQEVSNPQTTTIDRAHEKRYNFDITGDGIIDSISMLSTPEGVLTKIINGESQEESHKFLDTAREKVFSDLRFDNVNNSVGPANCYRITYGSQGEEVLKFLVDSNKYSDRTEITKLEELAVLIDTTANCNIRSNTLVMEYDEDLYNLNSTDSEAYKLTFGESVPNKILALNLGLGSAIYSTYRSDFNPRVKGSESLKISRGGANNMNLENLTKSLEDGSLLQGTIDSYDLAKRMYSAQFRASKTKLSREGVKF